MVCTVVNLADFLIFPDPGYFLPQGCNSSCPVFLSSRRSVMLALLRALTYMLHLALRATRGPLTAREDDTWQSRFVPGQMVALGETGVVTASDLEPNEQCALPPGSWDSSW